MTEAEQHRIIGQVVSELAETRKRLACLEAKAEKLSDEFGLLANWLRGHFPTNVPLANELSVAGAKALLAEIKDTKDQIGRLEERRAQLGV